MSKYFDWNNKILKTEMDECVQILKNDGIIIFPTETVYGIGANAISEKAVEKIFEVKKRPKNKAINIMVATVKEIEKYAIIKNEIERKIIQKFMPGPITIILEKKSTIPDIVTAGNNKVGIRIPDNKICLELLKQCNLPIAAPSANISGEKSGINIEEIIADFDGKIDAFIDGGTSKLAQASTIVEIVNNEIVIHRQGKITKEEIEKQLKS